LFMLFGILLILLFVMIFYLEFLMINKIYSIYDCKVEAYLQPFFLKSKGEAIRGFTELSNDDKTNIAKYPEDFTLFELGSYDDANAKFTLHSTPISIGKAIEFKRLSNPVNGDNIAV
jgi:hypothetical protein